MTATRLPRSSIGHSVAIISVIVAFAVVVFWFVFVALMTVVVANDGIVVRIPVASAWHLGTAMFFMPVGIIFVRDHLIASKALLGTVVVGLAYLGTLGFLAFVPSIIVVNYFGTKPEQRGSLRDKARLRKLGTWGLASPASNP